MGGGGGEYEEVGGEGGYEVVEWEVEVEIEAVIGGARDDFFRPRSHEIIEWMIYDL